ncbi:MAG: hypothetical protein Tsb0021_09160 [Chlamydiales bacterium]
MIDLFEKCVLAYCSIPQTVRENRYFSHIKDKHALRCIVLLIPILGNGMVAIYDFILKPRSERRELEYRALRFGINEEDFPRSTSELRTLVEQKREEELQEKKQKVLTSYEQQISLMNQTIEKFQKVINDPNEEIEIQGVFGIRYTYNGTHQQKINYYWSNIKLLYSFQGLGTNIINMSEISGDDAFQSKKQRVSQLQNQLTELRFDSYKGYIETLSNAELLNEAKKYYLKTLSEEEQLTMKDSIDPMNFEDLLPKLQESLSQGKDVYQTIEIKAIVLKLE